MSLAPGDRLGPYTIVSEGSIGSWPSTGLMGCVSTSTVNCFAVAKGEFNDRPDGKWVLYTINTLDRADLVLVENFR